MIFFFSGLVELMDKIVNKFIQSCYEPISTVFLLNESELSWIHSDLSPNGLDDSFSERISSGYIKSLIKSYIGDARYNL